MSNPFFDHPILNSPYDYPTRHWELDEDGQPTQKITGSRRRARFIMPIPKPKKRKKVSTQDGFVFDEGMRPSSLVFYVTYWVPGVNHLGTYGRWAFAEFTEVYQIEADFKAKMKSDFDKMIGSVAAQSVATKE